MNEKNRAKVQAVLGVLVTIIVAYHSNSFFEFVVQSIPAWTVTILLVNNLLQTPQSDKKQCTDKE